MIKGNTHQLEEYLNRSKETFDLFIGSISFEKRCMGAGIKIKDSMQNIKHKYFLDYLYLPPITSVRNVSEIKHTREERIKLQSKNRKEISNLFSEDTEFPSIKIEDPILDTVTAVENFFKKEKKHINKAKKICIDISTFTKPLFFLIIKMIILNFKKKHLFIINTIPKKYTPLPLSFNIWGTEIMPGYNGIWNPQKRNVLITVIGFEGHKLSRILEKWNFAEVIPLVSFPAYYPGLQDRALSANAEVLKRVNALQNLKYSPALDPFVSYSIIKDIFEGYFENYNVAIAPLGPKTIVLASLLLSIKHNLRIVYTFPQEYNPSYSEEIGESFLYEIKIK